MTNPRLTIVTSGFIGCVLAFNFFPTDGSPHFRYTGSDSLRPVWNLGWQLSSAIYDQQTGLHIGPFAWVLYPIEIMILIVIS